jgi:integrase
LESVSVAEKLNQTFVKGLTRSESEYIVFDKELRGFGVRVAPSGRKTFIVQYRAGGRTRRVKLGVYGSVTVEQARIEAKKRLGEIAAGENPAETIRINRRAPTVAALCDRFLTEHVKVRCKPSTESEYRRAVELFIKPAFGNRKIKDIERSDIAKLHHDHRDIPYQANRTLGVLSKMFNLAEVWGLRPDGSNPTRHIKKYPEEKKQRFLSPKEIGTLTRVLAEVEANGSESPYAVAAFRLLLLTGCRLSEIQTLRWDYIEGSYIVLPDSKTGARRIPFAEAVQDVLDGIERQVGNPYVICGKLPGSYLTDLQHPWRRIRAKAKLDDVRIHDLRHTFASAALEAGLSLENIADLLGHSMLQTTARYAHIRDEIQRASAKQASGFIAAAMSAPPVKDGTTGAMIPNANVVPFRPRTG